MHRLNIIEPPLITFFLPQPFSSHDNHIIEQHITKGVIIVNMAAWIEDYFSFSLSAIVRN